jgi:hypothetical protein
MSASQEEIKEMALNMCRNIALKMPMQNVAIQYVK